MQRTLALLENEHRQAPPRDAVFQAVCRDCAEHVDADLVSIWLFEPAQDAIRRHAVYDATADTFEDDGMRLSRDDAPAYFRHIREETVIAAPDARRHPMTAELTEPYFRPLGIVSLLDFILHRPGFLPAGVICCENRRGRRDWSEADVTYLRRIASLTSLHFAEPGRDR